MSIFDVRTLETCEITEIVFASNCDDLILATRLEKSDGCVMIKEDKDDCGDFVYVQNEKDARNLILAIEKAIELGWFRA